MYDVVLLVEEELSVPDAERLVERYANAPDQVKFHVIIPCDDASGLGPMLLVLQARPRKPVYP